MNAAADARYQLARLQDLLFALPSLLRDSGVAGAEADLLSHEGLDFRRRLLEVRQSASTSTVPAAAPYLGPPDRQPRRWHD